jgi:hypothetical protein
MLSPMRLFKHVDVSDKYPDVKPSRTSLISGHRDWWNIGQVGNSRVFTARVQDIWSFGLNGVPVRALYLSDGDTSAGFDNNGRRTGFPIILHSYGDFDGTVRFWLFAQGESPRKDIGPLVAVQGLFREINLGFSRESCVYGGIGAAFYEEQRDERASGSNNNSPHNEPFSSKPFLVYGAYLPFCFIPVLFVGFKLFAKGIDCGGYLLPLGVAVTVCGALLLCAWVLWIEAVTDDRRSDAKETEQQAHYGWSPKYIITASILRLLCLDPRPSP